MKCLVEGKCRRTDACWLRILKTSDAANTAACAPIRFWCKLHTLQLVDSHNPTLPLLVKLYEQLLQVRGRLLFLVTCLCTGHSNPGSF